VKENNQENYLNQRSVPEAKWAEKTLRAVSTIVIEFLHFIPKIAQAMKGNWRN
jgi:hypothetical protein